ncbi:hypothetical protein CPC16_006053, partial [Podila verticillata]
MDEYLLEQSRLVGLHHSLSPFDGSARTPSLIYYGSRSPSARSVSSKRCTSPSIQFTDEALYSEEDNIPSAPTRSHNPGIVIEVPPWNTTRGTDEQDLSDLDPRLEEAESYTESYAESYAEPYAASEVQAEKEAEAQAEEETEAQAEKETKGEQVDYTRPRSERIKKRAMMESAGPDSPDSPDPAVPSTKRIKDDDHLVDVLALQQSLYVPLGKTYPYWLNQVIQQDRQTGRIRYVHAPLLRPFNQNHLTVLNAAFDAYKDQLEIMRDSNFEFISVLAECSPAQ